MTSVVIAILAAIALTSEPMWAQRRDTGPHPAIVERLNRMTPEQRQRALDRLPAERRARVEQRLGRLNSMPPKARERLREQYEAFQKLAPEKQEAVRQAFRDLNQLPRDRKPALRRAVVRLRNMTSDERNARLESEEFRSRFSDLERQIVRSLVETPPAPEPSSQE